jgi:hypothetical protein
MTNQERQLFNKLSGSSSLEVLPGGAVSKSSGVNAEIFQIVGNPTFKAEITLQIFARYYDQAVVGTPVASVPLAAQQTTLPVYIFGNIDWMSSYTRARQLVPGGAGHQWADMKWLVGGSGEVDYDPVPHAAAGVDYAIGSIFFNQVLNGDLLYVVPMIGFVPAAAATTEVAEVIVRCPNVPYTSLLSALSSDLITLNMIRYVVPVANVAQLANQITLVKSSLFGKTSTDTLDPQTFVTPGTFQPQIADIPITVPIDKNFLMATQMLYTAVVPIQMSWTLTISSINKLTQG